jgi:hypothetical protein
LSVMVSKWVFWKIWESRIIIVQIRPQVHISERLPALGLTRHDFVLCRKGALVGLKGVGVVYNYHLPRVPSDVGLFWGIQNRSPPVEAKGLKGIA